MCIHVRVRERSMQYVYDKEKGLQLTCVFQPPGLIPGFRWLGSSLLHCAHCAAFVIQGL
jgi:hypothetical protein